MQQRFNHIISFDQHILTDQLITILQRSPQTSQFIKTRISQIIVQIMSVPIIEQLQQQIKQMQSILDDLEQQKNAVTMSHSKQSTKNQNIIQKYLRKNKQLEKQMKILQEVKQERDNYRIHIQELEKSNIQYKEINGSLKQACEEKDREFQIIQKQCAKLQEQLSTVKKDNQQKQHMLKGLQEQIDKIRKLCKETKYHQIRYKKEGQKIQQQFQLAIEQLSKVKEQLSLQKSHRENQRKALSSKISQLYKKYKNSQKAYKKLIIVSQQNKKLKSQLQKLRQQIQSQISSLQEYTKNLSYKIMDQIGQQVNNQLKTLLTQISKNTVQVRICRQQLKIKDQIIQKLQKVSSVQVMGNRQLQKQLKSKKMEADSLRKQLKKNYEESQVKFMGLQNSYRQILANTANLYIR